MESIAEWRHVAMEVDAQLRLLDFDAVHKLACRLCELRPDLVRGWSLRHLAMKELQASHEELVVVLEEGLKYCKGSRGVQQLVRALEQEIGVQRRADTVATAAAAQAEAGKTDAVQVFVGEWDAEGVFVYQAYSDEIADWAVEHQEFGGPDFNATRMTWVKPSFAWVLYRSGYGRKHRQNRILKIKLSHHDMGHLLSECSCVDTNKATRSEHPDAGDGSNGRVQWDPERDIMSGDGKEPRMMLRRRAIQIGLKGRLSELYVRSSISIEDVTELTHRVFQAHRSKKKEAMAEILSDLPLERPYMPHCTCQRLADLGMLPGNAASALSRIGRGKAL